MQVIGHLVNDGDVFPTYFADDAPVREMMFFIEEHTTEAFKGQFNFIPTAFVLPQADGGSLECAVIADIMDCMNPDAPVLHLVLEPIIADKSAGSVMS